MAVVWIVEDEKDYQFMYNEILGVRFDLHFFPNIADFRKAIKSGKPLPAMIVADLRLPDESFYNFLKSETQPIPSEIPFIVVSMMDDIDILNECFSKGACDYITKPFNARELTVKIDRFIKNHAKTTALNAKGLSLNSINFSLTDGIRSLAQFTPKEFHIFSILMNAPNSEMSKTELIEKLWGHSKVTTNTLDVHICNLRKKVGPHHINIISGPGDQVRVVFDGYTGKLGNRMNQGA